MNAQIIREVLDEELATLIAEPVILWPPVAEKWAARQQREARYRVVRRSLTLALVVLIMALVVSPELRAAAWGALLQSTSIAGGPDQPVVFTPTPPFTVWQPDRLPDNLELVRTTYNPGFESQPGEVEISAGAPLLSKESNNPNDIHALFTEIDNAWTTNQAAILLIYRTDDGSEIWLYERRVLPGEPLPFGEAVTLNNSKAFLETSGQVVALTWIADGTRIRLRGTAGAHQSLIELAESLIVTSMAATPETAGVSSGVVIDVQRVTPDPTNASIWSHEPMLAQAPGQQFHGRFVVEVWTEGEHMFHSSDMNGNPTAAGFFDRITAALRDPETEILTTTPWTNDPVMGEIRDQRFLGRVVVEVWDEQITVAITGKESPALLVQRAIARVEQIQR